MKFNESKYREVFKWRQPDGRVVRAYMSNDPDNYHWCIIDGKQRYSFPNLTAMSKFCKEKSYFPISL